MDVLRKVFAIVALNPINEMHVFLVHDDLVSMQLIDLRAMQIAVKKTADLLMVFKNGLGTNSIVTYTIVILTWCPPNLGFYTDVVTYLSLYLECIILSQSIDFG